MNIKKLRLINFKNIEDSTINFKNNISGIYGPNGMGKTAILEAILLIKEYLKLPENTEENLLRRSRMIKFLESLMMKNKESMSLEITLLNNDIEYIIYLEFKRDKKYSFICSKEELYSEKLTRGTKAIKILEVDNPTGVIPNIIHGNTSLINKNMMNLFSNITVLFIENSNNLYSHLISTPNYFETINQNIHDILKVVTCILNKVIIITLKDQLHCSETIEVPIQCYDEKNDSIKTIIFDDINNIYSTEDAELLKNTMKEMEIIYSVIVPKAKIIFKSTERDINPETNIASKMAVKIFIEKDGNLLSITNESTGIIKLISLISALTYCIKNEKATVLIDELDVHIFEYLLSIILITIEKFSKGQLIFTAHNLLPMESLDKNSIIIAATNGEKKVYTNLKITSQTTNMRKKYLKSQFMWSEENIDPLLINVPALELFVKRLVRK
ncbi:AAA family ATPase [Cetobacterium sp. SF1]|uniref:AAA family ATPase n=1 Tax=Cetobacterium sp. SF1 TaxID=3417654 RepID=UPI003CEF08BC